MPDSAFITSLRNRVQDFEYDRAQREASVRDWNVELHMLDLFAADKTLAHPFEVGGYRFQPAEVSYGSFVDCWEVSSPGAYGDFTPFPSKLSAIEAVKAQI